MSYLQSELAYRELPSLLTHTDGTPVTSESWPCRREELLEILQVNSYGRTPAAPERVWAEVVREDRNAYAGKAVHRLVKLCFDTPKGVFSFPVNLFLPHAAEKAPEFRQKSPVFIHINFRPDVPDRYCPVEEILDNGFALAVFCYQDICADSHDGNFDQDLGAMFRDPGTPRRPDEWGKIGMWAYGCSRVLDWLIAEDETDWRHAAVVGHSRLGKTALWAAAQDERFFMGISNDSGFGGAAIHKKGTGERVADFIRAGSWDWYCETFLSYLDREDVNTVYDQHMLLACIAPRHICVGSALQDKGADPKSEFLNCFAQNGVYALLGKPGLVTPDAYPAADTGLQDGTIAYHMRSGTHFFSRTDWGYYMRYFRKAAEKEDPFYSAENMNAIARARKQIAEGRVVVKTMDELEAMANE
ncbi:MAG: hypothetical protein IJX14_11595 [Clostridia bacterium]|nr:hypothetical protein [Clostridia bacterium]